MRKQYASSPDCRRAGCHCLPASPFLGLGERPQGDAVCSGGRARPPASGPRAWRRAAVGEDKALRPLHATAQAPHSGGLPSERPAPQVSFLPPPPAQRLSLLSRSLGMRVPRTAVTWKQCHGARALHRRHCGSSSVLSFLSPRLSSGPGGFTLVLTVAGS